MNGLTISRRKLFFNFAVKCVVRLEDISIVCLLYKGQKATSMHVLYLSTTLKAFLSYYVA